MALGEVQAIPFTTLESGDVVAVASLVLRATSAKDGRPAHFSCRWGHSSAQLGEPLFLLGRNI